MLEVVSYAQSFTNNNEYKISRDKETGNLSCNCPAWIYKRGNIKNRRCKHINRFLEDIGVE